MTQIELGGSFQALIIINGAIKRMALHSQGTPERADWLLKGSGGTGEKDREHADVELVNGQLSARMGEHERKLWRMHIDHPSQCKARLTGRVRNEAGVTVETYQLTATVDATYWTTFSRSMARQCGLRVVSPFGYDEHELGRIADHALSIWREGPDDGGKLPDYPWGWFRAVQQWENARRTAGSQRRPTDPQALANRGGTQRGRPADGHPGGGGGRGAGGRAAGEGQR